MGVWGDSLYENDTALDVKDMIDECLSRFSDTEDAKSEILRNLDASGYDEEDAPVAWLTAASLLIKNYPAEKEYKAFLSGNGAIDVDAIRSSIGNTDCVRLKKRRYPVTSWRRGDVYVYDIREPYREDSAFRDYTMGLICVDFYAYKGVHPIVYIFRTKHKKEEIAKNADVIRNAAFWRIANMKERGYQYRVILFTESAEELPQNRLCYCFHTEQLPYIKDEFIIYDKPSTPMSFWANLEDRILRTKAIQASEC